MEAGTKYGTETRTGTGTGTKIEIDTGTEAGFEREFVIETIHYG